MFRSFDDFEMNRVPRSGRIARGPGRESPIRRRGPDARDPFRASAGTSAAAWDGGPRCTADRESGSRCAVLRDRAVLSPRRASVAQPIGKVPGGFQIAAHRRSSVAYTSPNGSDTRSNARKKLGSLRGRVASFEKSHVVNGSSSNARARAWSRAHLRRKPALCEPAAHPSGEPIYGAHRRSGADRRLGRGVTHRGRGTRRPVTSRSGWCGSSRVRPSSSSSV